MSSSRRTRRRRQQQSLRRHRFKLESLEKRYALDGDGLSISMNADYVAAGTTFPTDYGPGALANSGAPTNFFLPQGDLTPFSSESDSAPGMVITSLNPQGGKLWYSTNAGSTWSEITSASEASGTVLLNDGYTRLHYEPTAGFSGQISDVFSFKSYDFAASVASGTSQFDATVGLSLQSVGSYVIDHTLTPDSIVDGGKISLFSDGSRAATIHDDGLEILDISNPSSIQRIGITPSVSEDVGELFSDVQIAGDESSVFINPTAPTTNGAFVVDLADQSSPQLLPYDANTFAWTLTSNADGSLVVLGTTGREGNPNLYFFDTTNRASPQLLSTFQVAVPTKTVTSNWPPYEMTYESDLEVHSLTMSPDGNTLYVSCMSDSFFSPIEVPLFFVVDISDVNQPQEIAEVQNTSLSASLPVHCLSPDGNTLFVAGDNSSHPYGKRFLSAYNVSNPSGPTQMWRYEVTDGTDANRHYANEIIHDPATGKIYVAYDTGLRAYEIDGSGVVSETLISSAGMTNSVAVSADGQTIYVMGQELLSVYAEGQSTSVTVSVSDAETSQNDWFPVLDTAADVRLRDVLKNSGAPSEILQSQPGAILGTSITKILDRDGTLSNYTDFDLEDTTYGLAITRTNTGGGTLWFSIDGGSTWADVGIVSDSSARVLQATEDTRLYYQPLAGTTGSIYDVFSYKAWDTTGGHQNGDAGVNTVHAAGLGPDLMAGIDFSFHAHDAFFSANKNYLYVSGVNFVDHGSGPQLNQNSASFGVVETVGNLFVKRSSIGLSSSSMAKFLFESPDNAKVLSISRNTSIGGKAGVLVVDVSDPSAISSVGAGEMPVVFTTVSDVINGDTIYVVTDDRRFCALKVNWGGEPDPMFGVTSPSISLDSYVDLPSSVDLVQFWETSPSNDRIAVHPDGTVFLSAGNTIAIIDVSDSNNLQVSTVFSTTGTGQYGEFSKPFVSTDGNILSAVITGSLESWLINFDITDRTTLRQIGLVEVDWLPWTSILNRDAQDFLWSGGAKFSRIDNRNPYHPIELSGYASGAGGSSKGSLTDYLLTGGSDYPHINFPLEVYKPDFAAAFSNETEMVRVDVVEDSPSEFRGSLTGVLTVGRVAYGHLECSDSDGLEQGVLAVVVDGGEGDATVLPAGDGKWQWYYHAGPSFDGEGTFTVALTDNLGVETQQVITVTGEPSQSIGLLANMAIHQNQTGSLASYSLPAVGVQGESLNGGIARITATSSNQALIADPTTIYASQDVPSSISFTPKAGVSGSATISMQIEDGGADNNLATAHDNGHATHQIEVNVLEVISNSGSAILAKDSSESLYVNTQPVTYEEQQTQTTIAGFAAIRASSEDGENALLVERDSVTNRLVTDDAWRINGLFDSLQNESSPVLDLSGREVSGALNIAAVAGAYEISGVNNPTLIVRRGQTYTFNLDASGHPFYLQITGDGYQSANVYSDGFTGNGQTTGEHQWEVPEDAPDEIFYQCEFHPVMFGKIIVVD